VEVATFRSDVGYSDGRHPDASNTPASPEEDVKRRDFTINGLMLDPFSNEVPRFRRRGRKICTPESFAPSEIPTIASAKTSCV